MSVFNCIERTTAKYTATLKDSDDVVVPLTAIVSMVLTLKDVDSDTVINSRNAQNVLNTNNVTFHATSGLLTWDILPADNIIVAAGTGEYELHRAVFDVVYSASKRLVQEVYLLVKNVTGVS